MIDSFAYRCSSSSARRPPSLRRGGVSNGGIAFAVVARFRSMKSSRSDLPTGITERQLALGEVSRWMFPIHRSQADRSGTTERHSLNQSSISHWETKFSTKVSYRWRLLLQTWEARCKLIYGLSYPNGSFGTINARGLNLKVTMPTKERARPYLEPSSG